MHGHLPGWLDRKWDSYAEGPAPKSAGPSKQRIKAAVAELEKFQEMLSLPDLQCAAELPPAELAKWRAEFPEFDPATVRPRPIAKPGPGPAATKTEPKPEQRSNGAPGNVADDPELAQYLI